MTTATSCQSMPPSFLPNAQRIAHLKTLRRRSLCSLRRSWRNCSTTPTLDAWPRLVRKLVPLPPSQIFVLIATFLSPPLPAGLLLVLPTGPWAFPLFPPMLKVFSLWTRKCGLLGVSRSGHPARTIIKQSYFLCHSLYGCKGQFYCFRL